MSSIDEKHFIEVARPALACRDADTLAMELRMRWKPCQIGKLLASADTDVRRVAAISLGMIGTRKEIPILARALHDPDDCVNKMAEHSLWSIWFRLCKPEAAKPFQAGVALLEAQDYRAAIEHFQIASNMDPEFAEAFNQCAIAHYLLGEHDESIRDCIKTIQLMPSHFGAMAGIGHNYCEKGECCKAIDHYRKALEINPRLQELKDIIQEYDQCDSIVDRARI
jgi:tetratricopeptide (TPR) repeat protein